MVNSITLRNVPNAPDVSNFTTINISTEADLVDNLTNSAENVLFVLQDNITLTDMRTFSNFKGVFEGNSKTITLNLSDTNVEDSLFNLQGGTIKNLIVNAENYNVNDIDNGLLVESSNYGKIYSCTITINDVSGSDAGGLCGKWFGKHVDYESIITECTVNINGAIAGQYAGGLCGKALAYQGNCLIDNCNVNIKGDIEGDYAGGLASESAGHTGKIYIQQSNVNIGVEGDADNLKGVTGSFAGGFIGTSFGFQAVEATIYLCSVIIHNSVTGNDAGGFCGYRLGYSGLAELDSCSVTIKNNVTGSAAGGFVGTYAGRDSTLCTINNCSLLIKGSLSSSEGGGFCGKHTGSLGKCNISQCRAEIQQNVTRSGDVQATAESSAFAGKYAAYNGGFLAVDKCTATVDGNCYGSGLLGSLPARNGTVIVTNNYVKIETMHLSTSNGGLVGKLNASGTYNLYITNTILLCTIANVPATAVDHFIVGTISYPSATVLKAQNCYVKMGDVTNTSDLIPVSGLPTAAVVNNLYDLNNKPVSFSFDDLKNTLYSINWNTGTDETPSAPPTITDANTSNTSWDDDVNVITHYGTPMLVHTVPDGFFSVDVNGNFVSPKYVIKEGETPPSIPLAKSTLTDFIDNYTFSHDVVNQQITLDVTDNNVLNVTIDENYNGTITITVSEDTVDIGTMEIRVLSVDDMPYFLANQMVDRSLTYNSSEQAQLTINLTDLTIDDDDGSTITNYTATAESPNHNVTLTISDSNNAKILTVLGSNSEDDYGTNDNPKKTEISITATVTTRDENEELDDDGNPTYTEIEGNTVTANFELSLVKEVMNYEISTETELTPDLLANDTDITVTLKQDITLTSMKTFSNFKGVFEGNNKTITLNLSDTNVEDSLFNLQGGTIQNLNVNAENYNVNDIDNGLLVQSSGYGEIDSCTITINDVSGQDAGGLCGKSFGSNMTDTISSIKNCTVTINNVTGLNAGGLAGSYLGYNGSVELDSCSVTIKNNVTGSAAGGFVGTYAGRDSTLCTINNCSSLIKGSLSSSEGGGFCGKHTGSYNGKCNISQCRAEIQQNVTKSGDVQATAESSAFAGKYAAYKGGFLAVDKCTATVDGNCYGSGLLGSLAARDGTVIVTNNYVKIETMHVGASNGGLVGKLNSGGTYNLYITNTILLCTIANVPATAVDHFIVGTIGILATVMLKAQNCYVKMGDVTNTSDLIPVGGLPTAAVVNNLYDLNDPDFEESSFDDLKNTLYSIDWNTDETPPAPPTITDANTSNTSWHTDDDENIIITNGTPMLSYIVELSEDAADDEEGDGGDDGDGDDGDGDDGDGDDGDGGDESASVGDPYVQPMFGPTIKLPNIEAIYCLYHDQDLTVTGSTKNISKEHQQKIVEYSKQFPTSFHNILRKKLITEGILYDKFYIATNNQYVLIDVRNKSITTSKDCAKTFSMKMEEDTCNMDIFKQIACKSLNIRFKTPNHGNVCVAIQFFANPQIDNGIYMHMDYGMREGTGLLVRNYKPKYLKIDSLDKIPKKMIKQLKKAKNPYTQRGILQKHEMWERITGNNRKLLKM